MFQRSAALVALLALVTTAPAQAAVPDQAAPAQTAALGQAAVAARAAAPAQSPSQWSHRFSPRWPGTISGHAPSRYPEGVAWDPTRRAFLIGSIARGTVSVVDRTGRVRELVSDPAMVSTFGLHVDAARHRVLVTYGDMGLGERSSPDTTYVQSGVGSYDLRTGRLLHRVDLGTKALNPQGGKHAANDLAIDRRGNAYVTDPASDAIYRVTPAGNATVLVRDARLGSESIGMNGIVWDPAGFLLAVRYDTGALLKIALAGSHRIEAVRLNRPLIGGDGLALTPDRRLVIVTNKLGSTGVDALTVLRSSDGYRSAEVVTSRPWPLPGPTTIAITPYGRYVLSGRLDVVLAGGTSDEFDLRRG
jgi:sugar lactone lactonase YvrE